MVGGDGASWHSDVWHALEARDAIALLRTSAEEGLKPDVARERRARFGPNTLTEARSRSWLSVIVHQLASPLVLLLAGAAAIAIVLGELSDAVVIFSVVILNAIIGAAQEGRAERALKSLRRLTGQQARIVRGGREEVIPAAELVPGDIVLLGVGDAIPADARLIEVAGLKLAEAALTGESLPARKDPRPLPGDTLLADRRNIVYSGTHVVAGRGRAVVVATALATEIGRIAVLADPSKQTKTPLERRVAQFGRYVMLIGLFMFTVIVSIGLLRGMALSEIVMIGISQIVSLIPEGLPVAVTIALAVGIRRIARRGAIVRKLAAVETLGSTTIICSDKTGTLTRNEMMVSSLYLPDGRVVEVTGEGYAPKGTLREASRTLGIDGDRAVRELIEAGALCNDAKLAGPDATHPLWRAIGDPTEAALITLAMKAGVQPEPLRARYPRRAEIPFDADAKAMATSHVDLDGSPFVILKGAPEVILGLCEEATSHALTSALEGFANPELRLLAFARVEGVELGAGEEILALRGRARCLGLVGEMDPPRVEVEGAIEKCAAAGIRTVMVTGDHKATGLAVARMLGMSHEGDIAVDGRELDLVSDSELAHSIGRISVFARVHPAQKLRIVEALQRLGEIVAVTGDGVNDAPALMRADVGVTMGISGTEVAKEAADIVIMDDNFATVVAAVEEGRVVYRNLKKVISYLLSTSMAEVLVLLAALLLGFPAPLAAVQILWINLVTEGTVTVNLILEPPEGNEMNRPPVPPAEPLLTRALLLRTAFLSVPMAVVTLGWYLFRLESGAPFVEVATETFTLLAICQWFNVLNCRSERRSALNRGILRNRWIVGGLAASVLLQAAVVFLPPLRAVFHTAPFGWVEALAMIGAASLVLWVEEIRKLLARIFDLSISPLRTAHFPR